MLLWLKPYAPLPLVTLPLHRLFLIDILLTLVFMQLYAICAFAEDRAGNCSLNLRLLMPSCSLLATPLYTKRLCNVPLAEALLKPGKLQFLQVGPGTSVAHSSVATSVVQDRVLL